MGNKDFTELQHPYLFFSDKDINLLRERIKEEPFATRWQLFKQNADQVLETSPPEPGNIGMATARKYLENAGKTAFAYVITGEKKYAERAVAEAMDMVSGMDLTKEIDLNWQYSGHDSFTYGDLGTSETSLACALIYDWCYDVLTSEEKRAIELGILHRGLTPYLSSIEKDEQDFWVNNQTSNWSGVVHGGSGVAALAIYDLSVKARKAARYAREKIPYYLHKVVLEDSGGHEGIMYNRYGIVFALKFLHASLRLFGDNRDLLRDFNEKMAGYWDVYMQSSSQKYANFNNMGEDTFTGLWGKDGNPQGGPHSDISAFYEMITPGGDPLLLWAADNGGPRFFWEGASAWYFLWRRGNKPRVPTSNKPQLQDAVLFRGAGHAIFRTEDIWLAYNGGWISDESHSNRDLGTFVLDVGQERLINDPGYGSGETRHHSTITINGEGQYNGARGKYLKFGSADNYYYISSDLSNVYKNKDLEKFIRHLLIVKGENPYIVILDDLAATIPSNFTWRLQTRNEPQKCNENIIISGEKEKLNIIPVTPEEKQLSIEEWIHQKNEEPIKCIKLQPKDLVRTTEIITLFYPFREENINFETAPKVNFNGKGVLQINNNKKLEDIIIFDKIGEDWKLKKVNNEDTSEIGDGTQRSLKSYRGNVRVDIDKKSFPPWFNQELR